MITSERGSSCGGAFGDVAVLRSCGRLRHPPSLPPCRPCSGQQRPLGGKPGGGEPLHPVLRGGPAAATPHATPPGPCDHAGGSVQAGGGMLCLRHRVCELRRVATLLPRHCRHDGESAPSPVDPACSPHLHHPCALPPLLPQGEFETAAAFPHLRDSGFLAGFCLSSCMGLLLTYSSVLSTTHNSPLATSVTGNVKVRADACCRLPRLVLCRSHPPAPSPSASPTSGHLPDGSRLGAVWRK